MVIGHVEKLQSADNPTEIAHGFSVRVENKHTRAEYLMNGPQNVPKLRCGGRASDETTINNLNYCDNKEI